MHEDRPRLNILLIEDDPRRLQLVKAALERANTRCRLHTVGAGSDAFRYLRREAPFSEAPTPDLVLCDFSQPEQRNFKLIENLKSAQELTDLPFALLTRPETEQMLEEKYTQSGNCVMFSPINLADFLKTMNTLRLDRFMNAVSLIARLGFVLVRAPDEFAEAAQPAPRAQSCKLDAPRI